MIQQRMGHSSITLTMDVYGHLFPGDDDGRELAAAEALLLTPAHSIELNERPVCLDTKAAKKLSKTADVSALRGHPGCSLNGSSPMTHVA